MRFGLSFLSAKPKPSFSQPLITDPVFMVPDLSGSSLPVPLSPDPCWTGFPELATVYSRCGLTGADQKVRATFLDMLSMALHMWPGVEFVICTGQVRCLLLFSLVSTIIPSPFEPFLVASHSVLMCGVISSHLQNFVLLHVECQEVLLVQFSHFSRFLWIQALIFSMSTTPFNEVSWANLLRVQSICCIGSWWRC